jgi:hypothetical protein
MNSEVDVGGVARVALYRLATSRAGATILHAVVRRMAGMVLVFGLVGGERWMSGKVGKYEWEIWCDRGKRRRTLLFDRRKGET